MDDDGTREHAVRELGEDAVRALEVEVVNAHADRLSPGTFVAMGMPAASVLAGLGWQPAAAAPTRRENDGLSVRARGRLDQAIGISGGRLTYQRPAIGEAGEVSVRIETTPAEGPGQAQPASVKLTRHSDGDVALQLNHHERPVPGTDAQAAHVLGLDREVWGSCRRSLELGLAAVAGQRPALLPPNLTAAQPKERADLTAGLGVSGPGAVR